MEERSPLVTRIRLPGEFPPAARRSRGAFDHPAPARIAGLSSRIRASCAGRAVSFDISLLDLDRCPAFQRKVLLAEYGIPRGSVSTYGRIARRIGHPGASRAVGTALAKNPFPIVIPCHRAVRAGGALGGFRGGLAMKRRLLELEGVAFTERGNVAARKMHYDAPQRAARPAAAKRKERP
jgi:methylated-DNA-[protein]-cysteine S-methyltransferase